MLAVRATPYSWTMARQPRRIHPGSLYHLISRFVDREWFIETERERQFYLRLLGRALERSNWRCVAFAIMSNHIHLAAIAGTDPLDSWIRRVHSPFADTMNRLHERIGAMFVRGPKALPVEPSGVGNVIAYIHNNPVRANIVRAASESSWTSHRSYLGVAGAPSWLHVAEGLQLAKIDRAAFDRWVNDDDRLAFDDSFDETAEEAVVEPVPNATLDVRLLVEATARTLGIPVAQLCSRRRSESEVTGREVVVRCGQHFGVRPIEISRALGVSQQAVSAIGRRRLEPGTLALADRVSKRLGSCESCD
jgi:REP element-mobilizing transposase RayT